MFDDPRYPTRTRSFHAFKRRIRGFNDDELRRILLEIGAEAVNMAGTEGWRLSKITDADEQ